MLIDETIMINYLRGLKVKTQRHSTKLTRFLIDSKSILPKGKFVMLSSLCREENHFIDGLEVTINDLKRAKEKREIDMKYLPILCLCVLLSGCAYISHTVATMKAKDVKAVASGVPVGAEDAKVLFDRTMEVYMFHNYKKAKGEDNVTN